MEFLGKYGIRKIVLIFMIPLFVSTLLADETRWISIGMLQNWFSSGGCEIEVGRRHQIPDQQDGFIYPALYEMQDVQAAKGLWIGSKNYPDPLSGVTYDYKVVHCGPRILDESSEFMPQEFKLIGKFDHPAVFVDGTPASETYFRDAVDEIDPNLKADRMLYNKVNTSIGITLTRKVYGYSQGDHDEYFMYDFKLENTGIYDSDGNSHNETLTDMVLFLQYRWAMTSYACAYGYYWTPQSATWGHNTVNEVLHNTFGDDYNAAYAFHGLHSKYQGNNIGGPNLGGGTKPANGFLGASQFPGVLVLHADQSPSDPSNDVSQFDFASHFWSDHDITQPNDQFNPAKMSTEYQFMTSDLPEIDQTHAAKLGFEHNAGWQDAPFGGTENADEYQDAGGGGISQGIGFGPYNLSPGDSIHIVVAECIGDISWEKKINVGYKWYKEETPYILPDGNETTDKNEYKDAWVFTGKDSLFRAFDRAEATWSAGLTVDPAPPPPETFEVNSGGDRISLEWANNAEEYDHFGGYRIYRQVGTADTTFELIHECGLGTGNELINLYEDRTAQRGFDYFYYVTAFDDGTVNTTIPGKTIESSLFWTRTIEPAYLRRLPGDNLENIRLVPNPFNIKARPFQFGQSGLDRLMFYNLPPKCKIRIYTERGDLIKTINHTDNSGDEAWDSVTSSRQMIVSGVYIAHIEVTETDVDFKKGDTVIKKFIVIR